MNSNKNITLTDDEKQFLSLFTQASFLPVSKFVLKSSKSDHLESVALAPVYLYGTTDSLDAVKNIGQIITRLSERNIIFLDYETPLKNCDYSSHEQSDVYALLKEIVAEGQADPNFVFDSTELQFGGMSLTRIGRKIAGIHHPGSSNYKPNPRGKIRVKVRIKRARS